MIGALVAAGLLLEGLTWWWVSARRADVWGAMVPTLLALGVLALGTGRPRLGDVPFGAAAGLGLTAGAVLYLATGAFLFLAVPRWAALERHATAIYAHGKGVPRWEALALSVAVAVPGEELFWRGLVLPELDRTLGAGVPAAALAWALYVCANLASRNLAIVAGSAVGGAVWVGLALWSGGVVAPIACHAVWTVLMLAVPPSAVGGGRA